MKKNILYIVLISLLLNGCQSSVENKLRIGSKKFTESVILGELVSQLARSTGVEVYYNKQLGGTRILWSALLKGDIDIYPEYTGTIIKEILSGKNISSESELKRVLESYDVRMSEPLGFNNTYAIGARKEIAEKYNLQKVSDLKNYPQLKFAFTNEFMDRSDGWRGLRQKYKLPQRNVEGVDHDIAYKGLSEGAVDVIDLYSTDSEIEYYDIKILKDDLNYFPEYNAVFLYGKNLLEKYPEALKNILRLEGRIDESEIVAMNSKAKIDKISEKKIASEFIQNKLGISTNFENDGFWNRLAKNTQEHISLVLISLFAAILISLPLGIIAFRYKNFGKAVLGIVGIIQTIPSLALLVFMIPFFGIGTVPAIAALFLYSLLPIVRNTYLGFQDISQQLRESAEVLGLSKKYILFNIEFPLAANSILTGIKTSAIINIGTATLGALIGAGGYGQPILTGIRLDSISLILEGAVPAALLALIVQFLFDLSEKILIPKGLRIKTIENI